MKVEACIEGGLPPPGDLSIDAHRIFASSLLYNTSTLVSPLSLGFSHIISPPCPGCPETISRNQYSAARHRSPFPETSCPNALKFPQ